MADMRRDFDDAPPHGRIAGVEKNSRRPQAETFCPRGFSRKGIFEQGTPVLILEHGFFPEFLDDGRVFVSRERECVYPRMDSDRAVALLAPGGQGQKERERVLSGPFCGRVIGQLRREPRAARAVDLRVDVRNARRARTLHQRLDFLCAVQGSVRAFRLHPKTDLEGFRSEETREKILVKGRTPGHQEQDEQEAGRACEPKLLHPGFPRAGVQEENAPEKFPSPLPGSGGGSRCAQTTRCAEEWSTQNGRIPGEMDVGRKCDPARSC